MKITRQESKSHNKALDLVHSDKPLSQDEREFVLNNYNPMADHDVGKAGIFFTPWEVAWDMATVTAPGGSVIDLCAGIGMLAYNLLKHDRNGGYKGDITELVCLEISHEFVQVGKRVLPEAVWIEGDVFDLELLRNLGSFDCAVSNPPYGNIVKAPDWLTVKTPSHLAVVEVGCRLAYNGVMAIIPSVDAPLGRSPSKNLKRFKESWPEVAVYGASVDISFYKDQWKGASPDVDVIDFSMDDCHVRPFGFGEPPILIEMPKQKVNVELKPVRAEVLLPDPTKLSQSKLFK